jgi:hypothetical protein
MLSCGSEITQGRSRQPKLIDQAQGVELITLKRSFGMRESSTKAQSDRLFVNKDGAKMGALRVDM